MCNNRATNACRKLSLCIQIGVQFSNFSVWRLLTMSSLKVFDSFKRGANHWRSMSLVCNMFMSSLYHCNCFCPCTHPHFTVKIVIEGSALKIFEWIYFRTVSVRIKSFFTRNSNRIFSRLKDNSSSFGTRYKLRMSLRYAIFLLFQQNLNVWAYYLWSVTY
jgi:hypothetical protein